MNKSLEHDVVINSYGIGSLMSAAFLLSKGVNVLLVDKNKEMANDPLFKPYELPISSGPEILSFFGLSDLNRSIYNDAEPVGVVFKDIKIDFKHPYLKEDVKRVFGQNQEEKFTRFIEHLAKLAKKRLTPWEKNKKGLLMKNMDNLSYSVNLGGINSLYDRYSIDPTLRYMVNTIMFIMSGVISTNYRINQVSSLLSSVLDGATIINDDAVSLRSMMLDRLKDHIHENPVRSGLLVEDRDPIKEKYLEDFNRLKGAYTEYVLYPFSLYAIVDEDFLSTVMPRVLIFIDADRSDYFEIEDIYVLRTWTGEDKAKLVLTSFMGFGSFDIDNLVHIEKIKKMRTIMERLVPSLLSKKVDVEYSSDIDDKDLYRRISRSDIIYDEKILNNRTNVFNCGREKRPHLGFEGIAISAISVADKVLRKIKK